MKTAMAATLWAVRKGAVGCAVLLLLGQIGCSGANSQPPDDPSLGPPLRGLTDLGPTDMARVVDLSAATGDLAGARGPLVINEVFPHGGDAATDPDFIELYNGGSGQVNLRGYKVRDDGMTWGVLPADAIIPAGGYYVINCDDLADGGTLPGAHVPFKLGGSGDEAHLASPDGTEIDGVIWGTGHIDIPKGRSLGRLTEPSGASTDFVLLNKPSRGLPNS